jgi:hypothetical protein
MTALNPYRVRLEMLSLNVTKDVEVGTTNKVATHTYPFSNKKTIEHLGTDSDIMTLEFALTQRATRGSANALKGWVRFLFLLSSKGKPVTLVHPLLGEQKIQILSLKQKASTYGERTLYPEFTMEFEIVDADAFFEQSLRDMLLFLLSILKAMLLNILLDSAFAQAFKAYKQKGNLLKSLMSKLGLEAVYDVVTGGYQLLKDGIALGRAELAILDGKLNSTLTMLNNGALGILGAKSKALAGALKVQNRIASVFNIWNNLVSATKSFLDFGKMSNIAGYASFVSAFDNSSVSVPPLKRNEVVTICDSITTSISSYKNTLDKEVLSTRDFVLTNLESEDGDIFIAEEDGASLLAEESVTRSQALSKLSVTRPESKELLSVNDTLSYATYVTMLMFMVDSVVNADLEDPSNAVSLDSVDKITQTFEAIDQNFSGKVDENLHAIFVELKNTFQKYKVEIAPFIYEIETVNTLQDILPNLIYNSNGNLELLEDTLALNDTLFLDDIEGNALIYRELD